MTVEPAGTNAMEITAWLRSLGLERYEPVFRANDIDMDILPQLTAEDLSDLGVISVGHRRKLLGAIATLHQRSLSASKPATRPSQNGPDERPAPTLAEAERRQLTVVFCDLVGSTDLSTRLDPEELREIVRAYQDGCATVIDGLGGHVARYLGDGVLAYFGYPKAHGDDTERAVRAGLDLITAVSKLQSQEGVSLQARVGIATGLVVVGDLVGTHGMDERTVFGETPNLAARLQALAEANAVVIAERTRKLVGGLFECKDLGEHHLKGFASSVPAWQVVGERPAASRFEALRTSSLTPFVGREREIALLLEFWERAKAGQGQIVLVSGEPGIGKSRLVCALRDRITDEPHAFRSGQCSPLRQNSPLFPIIGPLERTAGFERTDTPNAWSGTGAARLSWAMGPNDEIGLTAELLEHPVDDHLSRPEQSPQKRKERLLDALVMELAGLAAQQPVLMVFEDAHWSDPTSLEFLGLVMERIRCLPVLLVITVRSEFQPPWAGLPHVTALALGDLGPREAAVLVERIAENQTLPTDVVDAIVERTGGVPLFVEELTKAALEADWHEPGTIGALAAAPLPTRAVPATLYTSLMARLDRLGPAREIAQIGAVIGRDFSYELLAPVAQWSDGELRRALDRLVAAGLVFRSSTPPQATFVFKHALVQDAAYATLLRTTRRDLHRRVAQVLETLLPDVAEAHPELLAHHCTEADMLEKAVSYWGRAGQQAIARSTMAEAVARLRKALELLPRLSESPARWQQELDLQTALGTALTATEGYTVPETGRVYDRARALCERLGDTRSLVRIAIGQSIYHLMRAEMDAALGVGENLLRRAEREDSLKAQLAAHRLVGITVLYTGRLRQAHWHLEAAASLLDRAGEGAVRLAGGKDALVAVPTYRAILLMILGHHDQARAQITRGLAEAERSARPHRLAFALAMALWFHEMLKEDASHLLTALDRLVAEQGFPYWTGYALVYRGLALARGGVIQEGLAFVREGVALHAAAGAAWSIPSSLGMAAELAEADEGLALVDGALVQVECTGVRWFVAELHRIRGVLLAAGGDTAGAEAQLTEAIGIARDQGAKHWELRAATSLARLWRDQGRCMEARDLLAPVYGWFIEGLGTPDLKEAKALLNHLE
jgi:class 3 adenylate cyclase/predicted ATPase